MLFFVLNKQVSRISDPPDWSKRNCLCDDMCASFGDCCPDARRFDAAEQRQAANKLNCVHLRQYGFNSMVDSCPSDWPSGGDDDETRALCETAQVEWENHRDPLMSSMPVTSTVTAMTYRNIHCAICRRDTPPPAADGSPQLRFWNPRLECTDIAPENSLVKRLDKRALFSQVNSNVVALIFVDSLID